MERRSKVPELASVVWPQGNPREWMAEVANKAPWLAYKLAELLESHSTEQKVNIALVDTAIHFGMALEAVRNNRLQPTPMVPLEIVEALALDYAERFRRNFETQSALQNLAWSVMRTNANFTAGNMARATHLELTAHAADSAANQVAAVTTATDQVSATCQTTFSSGAGIICETAPL